MCGCMRYRLMSQIAPSFAAICAWTGEIVIVEGVVSSQTLVFWTLQVLRICSEDSIVLFVVRAHFEDPDEYTSHVHHIDFQRICGNNVVLWGEPQKRVTWSTCLRFGAACRIKNIKRTLIFGALPLNPPDPSRSTEKCAQNWGMSKGWEGCWVKSCIYPLPFWLKAILAQELVVRSRICQLRLAQGAKFIRRPACLRRWFGTKLGPSSWWTNFRGW